EGELLQPLGARGADPRPTNDRLVLAKGVVPARGGRGAHVSRPVIRGLADAREVGGNETAPRRPFDGLKARITRDEDRRMRARIWRRNDADSTDRPPIIDLAARTEDPRPLDHRPVAAARVVRIGNLPDVGALLDRFFGPGA